MKRLFAAAIGLASLAGCASNILVPMGQDKYMIAKQQATGFSGLGNLKGEALTEGNAYCVSAGKQFEVLSATETKPPYALGNYPEDPVRLQVELT